MRLVQRGGMQHHVHAFHAGIDDGAVRDGAHDVREGRAEDVDADGFVWPIGERAHQRFAEMT